MSPRAALFVTVVVALAPELLRLVNDERARRHDERQRERDRENAREVARINAGGAKT